MLPSHLPFALQANILITNEHKACLSDFGLSSIIAEVHGTSYRSSSIGGALRWCAPQLYSNTITVAQKAPTIGMLCDIYSFGSVMLQVYIFAH